jgi:HK97 family phage major capsid protein
MFELPSIKALSVHERKNYLLTNVVSDMLAYETKRAGSQAAPPDNSLGREISASLAKDLGMVPPHGGIFVAMGIQAAGVDTRTASGGGYTVGVQLQDIIGYLRAKSVCLRLGATLLSGLTSGAAIPLQSAGSTASWVSENPTTDAAQTDSSFGQLVLSARTLAATTSYSRQLLSQSSVDVEAFLREDLAAAHAAAIDSACFAGSGSNNQPTGLLSNASVPVIALGTNGLAPTAQALCSMEQSVADASADLGQLSWATTPGMRNKLRQVPMFTGATLPCWTGDEGADFLLGSPAVVSRSIPQTLTKGSSNDCHLIVCGYFPALAIGTWGVMELVVDPFAQRKRNVLEVTSYQLCDVAIRRPTAFALCADARNI